MLADVTTEILKLAGTVGIPLLLLIGPLNIHFEDGKGGFKAVNTALAILTGLAVHFYFKRFDTELFLIANLINTPSAWFYLILGMLLFLSVVFLYNIFKKDLDHKEDSTQLPVKPGKRWSILISHTVLYIVSFSMLWMALELFIFDQSHERVDGIVVNREKNSEPVVGAKITIRFKPGSGKENFELTETDSKGKFAVIIPDTVLNLVYDYACSHDNYDEYLESNKRTVNGNNIKLYMDKRKSRQ